MWDTLESEEYSPGEWSAVDPSFFSCSWGLSLIPLASISLLLSISHSITSLPSFHQHPILNHLFSPPQMKVIIPSAALSVLFSQHHTNKLSWAYTTLSSFHLRTILCVAPISGQVGCRGLFHVEVEVDVAWTNWLCKAAAWLALFLTSGTFEGLLSQWSRLERWSKWEIIVFSGQRYQSW